MVLDGLRVLAGTMATESATAKLNDLADEESDEYNIALEEARERIEAAMLVFWEAAPAFASAVAEMMGPNMKELI